ncbi:MAG: pirin family protein [Ignavibacteriota bacterium]|jgi:redox-sensitive bicupin YhaK (pirin superfamily)|nr:MAG: pirin family protein [Chlorobiota bacterium]MBE7477730.1 pirin family protein [Ignavibacteriales bacterium]MBL1123839.1 pirin family protein [Ignavibacteriota bacterium]MCC7095296.1 pirin family protein [Ignavibacteriaceae bacterium]MCE7855045.1 pirin family protein [Ignavibacteria bacterium CHB3]MEB2295730.1 pirin family protein [Ignavibacteria bacterium]
MSTKKVELVAAPAQPHFVGDGFRVHNFIPSAYHLEMERMNPFIVLDYNSKFYFPASDKPRGVGVHPHKGFETVTIAYKGRIAHHDSSGGGGIIGEGDVQWMTAASGILHKEYHEESWSKAGGDFQMVQLWVNLPAKYKLSNPKYQAITNSQINRFILENGQGEIEVIAGQFKNIKGAASTFSPINLFNAKLNKGAKTEFNSPAKFNTALLVIEGNITVNDSELVKVDHFVLFENKGETFTVLANEESTVLILSGEPINEPIAAHGPFVMNTREEIMQAYDDFNKGKFGYLED